MDTILLMISRLSVLLLVMLFTCPVNASTNYYESREWLNVLYYEKSGDGYKSLADGTDFFVSTGGGTNPESEYRTALELTKKQDDFFRRNFPLRYKLLANYHAIPYRPLIKIDTNIESVVLAYPNRYMTNPASMFGHLFLVFKSKRGLMDSEIFHFIADTSDSNQFEYITNGLTGKFKGWFLREPYYRKIKKYNYQDDREVIYYDLDLSSDQIENIVLHSIELKRTHFDYYFLDENCALFMGKALNVVLDEDIISNEMFVLPTQVVNNMQNKKMFTSEYKRLSNTKLFSKTYNRLSPSEKKEVVNLILYDLKEIPENARVLIAFIHISEYLINNYSHLTSNIRQNRILVYKALAKMDSSPVRPTVQKFPPRSIDSQRLSVLYDFTSTTSLSYSPIYYDNEFNEVEVKRLKAISPSITFRRNKKTELGFSVAEISNISAYNDVLNTYSWKINSYFHYNNSLTADHSYEMGLANPVLNETLAFMFLGFNFSNYNQLTNLELDKLSFHPSFSLGVMSNLLPSLKGVLKYEYRYGSHYIVSESNLKVDDLYFALKYVHSEVTSEVVFSMSSFF
jgi:hypothetical protein